LNAPVWIQKFGGTSIAGPERIKGAALRIRERVRSGRRVVAVVSAMGDTTDRLLELAAQLSASPPRRELDVLLSAGEVQSMALLVIALEELGLPAVSLTGWQGGILTDNRFSEARIQRIEGGRIERELNGGRVVVVAGFQGVTDDEEITTLGRGGSDTSAVAIAAALGAECCEILTDVPGVTTTDPRLVPHAQLIEELSFDEMLEMAAAGAKVLHDRAVDLARRYQVPIIVASARENGPGTRIGPPTEKGDSMESVVVRGISQEPAVRKVSILQVPDRPGVAAHIFGCLGRHGVRIRLVVQAQSHAGHNDITFIIPDDEELPEKLLEEMVQGVGGNSFLVEDNVGLLSVIGEGIAREPAVAAAIFAALSEEGINIDLISSSNLVITCVVPQDALDRGTRALHRRLIESG
jgi:aspartate kinase